MFMFILECIRPTQNICKPYPPPVWTLSELQTVSEGLATPSPSPCVL